MASNHGVFGYIDIFIRIVNSIEKGAKIIFEDKI